MECFYYRDLFSCLCQFLNPPDILSLGEVNTRFHRVLLESLVKDILIEEKAVYELVKRSARSARSANQIKRWYPGIIKMLFKYNNGNYVRFPRSQFTYELCKIVVNRYCYDIFLCPAEFMTDELCMIAMNASPYCVKYIPEEICRKNGGKYCAMAVDKGVRWDSIRHICIPEGIEKSDFLEKITERAVAANADNIKHISRGHISPQIRKLAVERQGSLIRYCDIDDLDREEREMLCSQAVKKTPTAFNHINKEYWPLELMENAVKQNPYSLIYLMHVSTDQMRLDAVMANGMLLQHIKKKERTLEVCREAFRQTKECLRFIPQKYRYRILDT